MGDFERLRAEMYSEALAIRERWAAVSQPLTLRDLRRVCQRTEPRLLFERWRYNQDQNESHAGTIRGALTLTVQLLSGRALTGDTLAWGRDCRRIACMVDRLISRYGADREIGSIISGVLASRWPSVQARLNVDYTVDIESAYIHLCHAIDGLAPIVSESDSESDEQQQSGSESGADPDSDSDSDSDSESDPESESDSSSGSGEQQNHAASSPSTAAAAGSDGSADAPSTVAVDAAAREDAETPTEAGANSGCDEQTAGVGSQTLSDGLDTDDSLCGEQVSAAGTDSADMAVEDASALMQDAESLRGQCADSDSLSESLSESESLSDPLSESLSDSSSESDQPLEELVDDDPDSESEAGSGSGSMSSSGQSTEHTLAVGPANHPLAAARECARLLAQIVEPVVGARGRVSPRVDGRALVRELVSRRVSLERARRYEAVPRHMLITVDDSPSCEESVQLMYPMAVGIARQMPAGTASVLVHSNGYKLHAGEICAPSIQRLLRQHEHSLQRCDYYSSTHRQACQDVWYESIRITDTALVLNIGDADTDWILEELVKRGHRVLSLETGEADASWKVGQVTDPISAWRALRAHVQRSHRRN